MSALAQIMLPHIAAPHAVRDGLAEERRFRTLLQSSGNLEVHYTAALDHQCAIDALVRATGAPPLFPVGVQFTLAKNAAKKRRAIERFRQTRAVPRFLYLRCAAPLTRGALDPLRWLIHACAASDEEHAIASAVLVLDNDGRHVLEGIRHYPMNPLTLE